MKKLPIVLDNIVDENLQLQIENSLFDCDWKFNMDVTYGYNSQISNRKFLNPFKYDIFPGIRSNLQINKKIFNLFYPVVEKTCSYVEFEIEKVERCVSGMHFLIPQNPKICNIHINHKMPHLVFLYYVTDADGDTILYDKTINDVKPQEISEMYLDEKYQFNIEKKISPKKGRILLFDGRTYHSSSSPTTNIRCIITLDLFGEFKDGSYKFPAPIENKKNKFIYQ
jgi:hypothetical protein